MEGRREFLAGLGMMLAAGAAPADAKLADAVKGSAEMEGTKLPFGVHRIYYQGPTDMLKTFEGGSLQLNAGMEPHPPHQHPEEEILLVTEGTGEISIDGEVTKVGPGAMMYTAANRLHGIKNSGKKPLLFYYFKWEKA